LGGQITRAHIFREGGGNLLRDGSGGGKHELDYNPILSSFLTIKPHETFFYPE
jgi:hypothetical protein